MSEKDKVLRERAAITRAVFAQLANDSWGCCTTCGQPTGSADLWQDTCPRCAELAELEREIWRAVKRVIQQESELDALTARWRQLHAAGAESEQM